MNSTNDKVHPTIKPSSKTTPNATRGTHTTNHALTAPVAATGAPIKFPPTKAQQLKPAIRYRPVVPPPSGRNQNHRTRRQCCSCRCCFLTLMWATLIIIAFLVLAAVTATVCYFLYRPRPPSYELISLKIAKLNLTSVPSFSTKLNLTMITKNSNDKIIFNYNPINVTILAMSHKQSIEIAKGSFPAFEQYGKNMTSLFAVIKNNNIFMDEGSLDNLRSGLKDRLLSLQVNIETEMRLKIGNKVKSNKFGLRTSCDGINVHGSSGNVTKFNYDTSGVKCKVKFFIKILEWDIPLN